jgi:hypothetical protein
MSAAPQEEYEENGQMKLRVKRQEGKFLWFQWQQKASNVCVKLGLI